MKQLQKLEAIRGFSALYVVLHHVLPHNLIILGFNFSHIFRFGQEAVILFFLLSGFVIHYAFSHTKDKTFSTYITKRGIRIYIPLILIYLISFLSKSYVSNEWVNVEALTLLGNLFMFQDVEFLRPNTLCQPLFGNTPLWSLSYEFWFYMIYFFIQKNIEESKQGKFVYGMVVIATLSYLIFPFFLNRILMYFGIWWGGVALAKNYLINKRMDLKRFNPHLKFIGLISLLLLINIYLVTDFHNIQPGAYPFGEFRHFAFSLIVIVIGLTWQKYKWISFNLFLSPFAIIAKISYVLYILHHPLMFIIADLNEMTKNLGLSYIIYFIVVFSLSYLIEIIIYPHLKKFIMSLLNRRSFLLMKQS